MTLPWYVFLSPALRCTADTPTYGSALGREAYNTLFFRVASRSLNSKLATASGSKLQKNATPAEDGRVLQLKQQLSRSSPSLALQNLPAGLQISVQGTTDPLSKQPSLVVQLLQPEGLAGERDLAEGGRRQELPPQGTSSEHQVGFDCAPAQGCTFILGVRIRTQHSASLGSC